MAKTFEEATKEAEDIFGNKGNTKKGVITAEQYKEITGKNY